MTSIPVTFSATAAPPFSTQVTLDGDLYTLSFTWNLIGRWYYTIIDQYGNLVYSAGLVGSPQGYDILLCPGIFQLSTLLYRSGTGSIEVGP